MTNQLGNFVVETLYSTFVLFFYYYLTITFIQFNPFSLGFHPSTNLEQLSVALLIILVSITIIKSFALISVMANAEDERPAKKPSFYPGHRH